MHAPVRPRFVPTPVQDSPESGRLILRDGTTAHVRPARPEDEQELTRFFGVLAAEAPLPYFRTVAGPGPEVIARRAAAADPCTALTLVVVRASAGDTRIIATGTYTARNSSTVEVALAVASAFRGKGLGTLLLERLALLAVRNSFTRFWARPAADNAPMLEVLRASGFELRERPDGGDIEISLDVAATEGSVAHLETRDRVATVASLLPLFRPNAVAVVGASRNPATVEGRLLDALVRAGFRGPVYPVNPNATEIAGLKAYPSVSTIPSQVDLAILAVPASAVPGVVDDCAARGVRALAVVSAGFADAGGEGVARQKALLEKVRSHGMRMVGPNCLGLLNADPAVQLNASFSPVFPPAGRIAMSSQSGAIGLAALSAARRCGLGFSTFVSVGNKAERPRRGLQWALRRCASGIGNA